MTRAQEKALFAIVRALPHNAQIRTVEALEAAKLIKRSSTGWRPTAKGEALALSLVSAPTKGVPHG
jgi:hypothetical protein